MNVTLQRRCSTTVPGRQPDAHCTERFKHNTGKLEICPWDQYCFAVDIFKIFEQVMNIGLIIAQRMSPRAERRSELIHVQSATVSAHPSILSLFVGSATVTLPRTRRRSKVYSKSEKFRVSCSEKYLFHGEEMYDKTRQSMTFASVSVKRFGSISNTMVTSQKLTVRNMPTSAKQQSISVSHARCRHRRQ